MNWTTKCESTFFKTGSAFYGFYEQRESQKNKDYLRFRSPQKILCQIFNRLDTLDFEKFKHQRLFSDSQQFLAKIRKPSTLAKSSSLCKADSWTSLLLGSPWITSSWSLAGEREGGRSLPGPVRAGLLPRSWISGQLRAGLFSRSWISGQLRAGLFSRSWISGQLRAGFWKLFEFIFNFLWVSLEVLWKIGFYF